MKVIRRQRPRWLMPVPVELNWEKVEMLIATLVGGAPTGRAQKKRGCRFDVYFGTNGEVKYSDYHPYRGGFRHNYSNVYGYGEGSDAEHYVFVGRRRLPFESTTPLDRFFFFLFFSRSQLKIVCRGNTLNLPVNWEPSPARPNDRIDTIEKNAAICNAVRSAKEIAMIDSLVAANPNVPNVRKIPRTRRTMRPPIARCRLCRWRPGK